MLRNDSYWPYAGGFHAAALMIAAASVFALGQPAEAQRVSPEILAKERSDPAAGEPVIINRKAAKPATSRTAKDDSDKRVAGTKPNAPDPYAPIKLKPLPEKAPSDHTAPKSEAQREAASSARKPGWDGGNRVSRFAPPEPVTPPPPLPQFNRDQRTAAAPPHSVPETRRQTDRETERDRVAPRDRFESEVAPRRWASRDDRDFDYESRRYDGGAVRRSRQAERPWRLCRQWAIRCDDGYEQACRAWQRRC